MTVALLLALLVAAGPAAADTPVLEASGGAAGSIGSNMFLGCPGDCNDSDSVDVAEIVSVVSIALAAAPLEACPALVDEPTVVQITQAVTFALVGCPEVVRLRLGDDSRIVHTSEAGESPVEERLSGRMLLVSRGFDATNFVFELTYLRFEGDELTVEPRVPARAGRVEAAATEPSLFVLRADVLINGAEVPLVGRALVDCCPPRMSTLEVIELCGPSPEAAACNRIRDGTEGGYSLFLYPELVVTDRQ